MLTGLYPLLVAIGLALWALSSILPFPTVPLVLVSLAVVCFIIAAVVAIPLARRDTT